MRIGSTRVIFIAFPRLSSLRRMTRSDLAGKMRAAPVLSIAVGTLVGAGFKPALAPSLGAGELSSLERDDFSSNHHPALTFCLSMIFFRKPVATFRDHALDDSARHYSPFPNRTIASPTVNISRLPSARRLSSILPSESPRG